MNNFGEFLAAVRYAGIHGADPNVVRSLQTRTAAGASEQVPGDGGFAVPAEFSRQLVERAYLTGTIMSRCMQMPITKGSSIAFPQFDESSRADGSRFGGVKSYWANEADTLTATKPKFLRSELTAKKLIGLAYLTEELFQDTAALDVFATAAFSQELRFRIEDSIVNGDGSGKPLGILKSPALVTVAKQGGQASGTIVAQNVIDVWARTWAPSRATSVWLAHPDAEAQLINLTVAVGTSGGSELSLYKPTENPDEQPFNLMLGRPVIPIEQCQVPGTPGDLILADFSRYVLALREVRTQISMEVKFLTDEDAFRFVVRVDGQPLDARPLTPFNGTNTTSPFVTIAAR